MIKRKFEKIKRVLETSIILARAEFKLRNEGSYLGIFWYLLNPILMFLLLWLVFKDRLGVDIPYYSLYLFSGIIIFNFFQNTTLEATRSIIKEHRLLIKSINFPREILILSLLFKNLFSHFFEILLFIFLLFFFKLPMSGVLYYFLLLIFFSFFIFGISLILSSLTVYFIDLENIWNFAVRLLWLATPIFYTIGGQARLFYFNLFNPLYFFITSAREILIYHNHISGWLISGIFGYSFLFLFIGLIIFNILKKKFGEMI